MSKANKRKKSMAARAQRRAAAKAPRPDKAASLELDPPYGYRAAGEDGALEPDDEEGKTIGRMRELAEKSLPIEAIAAQLNDEKLLARGHEWDAGAVKRILRRKVTKQAAGAKRTMP